MLTTISYISEAELENVIDKIVEFLGEASFDIHSSYSDNPKVSIWENFSLDRTRLPEVVNGVFRVYLSPRRYLVFDLRENPTVVMFTDELGTPSSLIIMRNLGDGTLVRNIILK